MPPSATAPAPPIPKRLGLEALRNAAQDCRACELWQGASQAVMGNGARTRGAHLMLVGEQPGDREDIEGLPFVGPAGRVLDEGLERAGIARQDVYVTNVVKLAERVSLTTHPSAILRQHRDAERRAAMDDFVADVNTVAGWLADLSSDGHEGANTPSHRHQPPGRPAWSK
jgi:uracil-DNA glycosylase